jgi:chromosome segregation ATPase
MVDNNGRNTTTAIDEERSYRHDNHGAMVGYNAALALENGPRSWELVTTMEEAQKMIATLEEELSRTRSMAQNQAVARDKAQTELDNLRQVAEDVNTENDMIVNDMQGLYLENDALHEELKMNRDTNDELEKKIKKTQAQCEELQDRIEACQGQAVDPQEVHEAVQQLRSTGNLKLKEAAKERQSTEEMVDSMRGELNDARVKMLQLVTEKDEMIRKYKSIQKKLKRCGCQGQKAIQEALCTKSIMSDEEESSKNWRAGFRKHLPGGVSENPPKVVAIDGNKQVRKVSIKRNSKTAKRLSALFTDQTDTSEPEAPTLKRESSFKGIVERAVREVRGS